MEALERFRRVAKTQAHCEQNYDADFVANSASSTTITVLRTNKQEKAVLIMSDTLGADNPEVFVYTTTDFQSADYFMWNGVTFFTVEQNHIVISSAYKKFKCFECNCSINDKVPAYFAGPLKATKALGINAENVTTSVMTPVVILPDTREFKIGDTIAINNQNWNVYGGDVYTINGVSFYYISRGVNSAELLPVDENIQYVGETITVDTQNGLFEANPKVSILSRTASKVTFVPLQAGDLQITTSFETKTLHIKEVC